MGGVEGGGWGWCGVGAWCWSEEWKFQYRDLGGGSGDESAVALTDRKEWVTKLLAYPK